jgi:hypothetical protein
VKENEKMDDYPNSAQIINRFEEERGEGGSNNEENLPAGNEEEAKRLQLNPIKTTVGEKLRNHANPSLPRLQIPKPKPMSQSVSPLLFRK